MFDAYVEFLIAGGTFEKVYLPTETHHGYNFVIGTTATREILNRVGILHQGRWVFSIACQKDSLDMRPSDRRIIVEHINTSKYKYVVLTHGTDTIHKTARAINKCLQGKKTVILTGSNQPSMARETDADFNLGMAVGAILHLEPGVYIALNGRVVPWYDFVRY